MKTKQTAPNKQAALKRNLSSMQVIKTLQLLLEDNYTMSQLVEKLNRNEKEPIFNNSVVSKYINTCRYLGIDVHKIHNRYYVSNLPFGLDLSARDIELLEKLQYCAKDKLSSRFGRVLDEFICKLNKYTNKHITRVEKKSSKITFEFFEKAVQEKRKIVLMFRAKSLLECIPIAICKHKGKDAFKVLYNGKEKNIAIERISGIEVLDKRFKPEEYSGITVIFKLKGGLALRYAAREHEQVFTEELPEFITVYNRGENKEELLTRLLRYDKDCEIVSPAYYREEMMQIISNMLKNYGVK